MRGIAFDLGTTTGWAAINGSVQSGVLKLKGGRFEGGGMRFMRFNQHLVEMINYIRPEWVVFEEVRRHAGTDAAHIYGGLMATLTAECERLRVPYEGVPVGTIKKFWTGSGNAPKEAMMAAARSKGFKVVDDNEADAIALLHWKMNDLLI